jgi:serine phosphatase RsbU (regulator of sigma subunit)
VFDGWAYEQDEVELGSGDRLVMYTDGITESRNSAGEEFGETRLINLLLGMRQEDASALADGIVDAATHFSNGAFDDDLTVVAVSVD